MKSNKKNFLKYTYRVLVSCTSSFYVICAYASTPSPAIYQPTASQSAYSNAGASSPGDYSSAEINPAILSALSKQYILFGSTGWQTYDNYIEGGIFDNMTTSVASLIKMRETPQRNDYSRDRSYNLSLSYQIPETTLSLGLGINYQQIDLTDSTSSNDTNSYGAAGFFYEFLTKSAHPIFIGFGTNNIFNKYRTTTFNTGVSTTFLDGYYSIGLDGIATKASGFQKVVGTLEINVNQFLDLKASYGYRTKDKKSVWGSGLFFRAPVLQVFYTVASSDTDDTTTLLQTAGAALNFMF